MHHLQADVLGVRIIHRVSAKEFVSVGRSGRRWVLVLLLGAYVFTPTGTAITSESPSPPVTPGTTVAEAPLPPIAPIADTSEYL